MKKQITLLIVLSAFLASNAQAGETTEKEGMAKKVLVDFMRTSCPSMINAIIDREDLKLALTNRPTDAKSVCSCALNATFADLRLDKEFTGEMSELAKRLESPQLKSYFTLRFSQTLLACLATDMDLSLEKSSPTSAP